MAREKIIQRKGLFIVGCILYSMEAIFSYMNVMNVVDGMDSKSIIAPFFVINGLICGIACTMIYTAIKKNKIIKILYWYLITCSILIFIIGLYLLIKSI